MTRLIVLLKAAMADLLVIDGAKIFLVNVTGAGLAFVSHVLFARWLTIESYGIYVFALSWLNILFITVQGGLNLAMVRFIAEYRALGNRAAMTALIRFSNVFVSCASGAVLVLGIAMVGWAMPDATKELRDTLYLALVLTAVLALIQQRSAILEGLERVVGATLIFEIVRPLALVIGLFGLLHLTKPDAAILMFANLLASMFALAILTIFARHSVRSETAVEDQPVPRWRTWLSVSLPYLAVTGMTILLTQMDILMIGHILGSEAAGLYAPASKVALLATFPVVAIRSRFGPMAANLFAQNRTDDLQSRLNTASLVSAFACLLVCIIITPGRYLFLDLFGSEYAAGEAVVLILTSGYAVYSVLGAVEMFFLVGPFERANAWLSAATLGVNFVLNLALIPRYGIEGAGAATAIAIVFRASLSSLIIYRRTGIMPWSPAITPKGPTA